MNRTLIATTALAVLLSSGCSTIDRWTAKPPGVFRIDVDQGNRFDQAKIDQLRPGMEKRQVAFVLGTPMVADMFNESQWDYIYWLEPGKGEITTTRVSLFFDDERLVRVAGDLRPHPADDSTPKPTERAYVVPPQEDKRGFFSKTFDRVTGQEE